MALKKAFRLSTFPALMSRRTLSQENSFSSCASSASPFGDGRRGSGAFVAEEVAILKPDHFAAAEERKRLQGFAQPGKDLQGFAAVRDVGVNDLVVHAAEFFGPFGVKLAGALVDGKVVFAAYKRERLGCGGCLGTERGGIAGGYSVSPPFSLIRSRTSLMSSTCSNRALATQRSDVSEQWRSPGNRWAGHRSRRFYAQVRFVAGE